MMVPRPSTTDTAPRRSRPPRRKPRLAHAFCPCDDTRTLCGIQARPVGNREPRDDQKCVVCLDLFEQPCARCGGWS
jgi:hypothetical protein